MLKTQATEIKAVNYAAAIARKTEIKIVDSPAMQYEIIALQSS